MQEIINASTKEAEYEDYEPFDSDEAEMQETFQKETDTLVPASAKNSIFTNCVIIDNDN
ncbi:2776_t:CDS:1, partial [Cetraspora pellucida]